MKGWCFAMSNEEKLRQKIEKMKISMTDLDNHIYKINEMLSDYDNVSIDELPMEFQDSIINLMKAKSRLIQQKLSSQELITKCEKLLLLFGE